MRVFEVILEIHGILYSVNITILHGVNEVNGRCI